MRITQSMLLQQGVQLLKQSESVKSLQAGMQIVAKIAAVAEGMLTLQLNNGETVQARDVSGQSYVLGEQVVFEVLGTNEEGQITLKALDVPVNLKEQEDTVMQLLGRLNLKDTSENKEMVKQFIAFRIPLSNENIKAAQSMKAQTLNLGDLIAKGKVQVDAKESLESLKTLIGKAVTQGTNNTESVVKQGIEKAVDGKNIKLENNELTTAKETILKSENHTALIKSSPDNKEPAMLNKLAVQWENKPIGQELQVVNKSQMDPASNVQKLKLETLQGILKEFDMEKIAFVIKNQLPTQLNVIENMDKIILGKNQLLQQLNELIVKLPENPETLEVKKTIENIMSVIKVKENMDPFDLKQQIQALNKEMAALSEKIGDAKNFRPELKEMLSEVKNSIDFLSKINDTATYIHVPIVLGKDSKQMDLYVQRDKNGSKKINPKDTKIFISLDTNHLKTVQCLVDIKQKRLELNFKVEDQEILDLFQSKFSELNNALEGLGFSEVVLNCRIFEKKMSLIDLIQNEPLEFGQLDIKV